MWKKQLAETAAMMMIGDSALALIDPKRHAALWDTGPKFWKSLVAPFVKNPSLTRCLGAAGLVAGICLAQCQQPAGDNHD